jgi:hypothetical protein
MLGGAGRPGAAAGAFGSSPTPGGSGCRGPDKICPGFGAGTGFAGMAAPRAGGAGAGGAVWTGADGSGAGGAGAGCTVVLASGGRSG